MGASRPYVVVHGGVHKTATSHLQSILQRNAGRLQKRGVHYVHHRDVRKRLTVPVQRPMSTPSWGMDWDPQDFGCRAFGADRGILRRSARARDGRLIVSDENMAGHCGHCVQARMLYRWRRKLIHDLCRAVSLSRARGASGAAQLRGFLRLGLCRVLRSAQGQNVIPEARMKQGGAVAGAGWTGFVDEVRAGFPEARLILWRHEDFGALSARIIGNLCGPGIAAALVAPARSAGGPRPRTARSRIAVRDRARRRRGSACAARRDPGSLSARPDWPGYDPWTPRSARI